ncbi:uncharacterized protein LOC133713099 [Rosa rugosa]|uniref:uncharacterized protein LOC133713099 n=1 Tax=Rosa rugosa TaxID=74645 RepID=UPI002B41281F|nr:uncharacterized protein LOC133713099 [Rosa rugosa]
MALTRPYKDPPLVLILLIYKIVQACRWIICNLEIIKTRLPQTCGVCSFLVCIANVCITAVTIVSDKSATINLVFLFFHLVSGLRVSGLIICMMDKLIDLR